MYIRIFLVTNREPHRERVRNCITWMPMEFWCPYPIRGGRSPNAICHFLLMCSLEINILLIIMKIAKWPLYQHTKYLTVLLRHSVYSCMKTFLFKTFETLLHSRRNSGNSFADKTSLMKRIRGFSEERFNAASFSEKWRVLAIAAWNCTFITYSYT